MLTVAEAQQRILDTVQVLPPVSIALLDAQGTALASDVVAERPLPPFDNSAMDGYAVRASDVASATEASPVRLRVLGEAAAGAPSSPPVTQGGAVRIMTGAPLPPGADAVVMVELTESAGDEVIIKCRAEVGDHIRPAGEDVPAGARVLRKGDELGPAQMGLLAALGIAFPYVVRRPRVALLTTGDEVVEPGKRLDPGRIYNSNRYALVGLIRETVRFGWTEHVPDDPDAVREALWRASEFGDLVISAGGVSVGEYDFVKQVIQEEGELDFWRIAMKPGKPLAFGRIGDTPFLGLPGNPVSSMVTFELFARPALRKMGGHREVLRPPVQAVLQERVRHQPGRQEYQRACVGWDAGAHGYLACPLEGQGSGMLRSMAEANALIVVPAESTGMAPGEVVDVLLLRAPAAFPSQGEPAPEA